MRHSIRNRFVVTTVGLLILPLVLAGSILIVSTYNIQKNHAIEHQSENAKHAAQEVENFVVQIENGLDIVAHIGNLKNQSETNLQIFLSKVESYQNALGDLALLEESGKVLAQVSRRQILIEDEPRDRSQEEAFTQVVEKKVTYYGPVTFDEYTGEPYMTMAVPIIDARSGLVSAVIISDIRIKSVWELIADINLGESSLVYIVDSQGGVIAHHNPSLVLQGTTFDVPDVAGIHSGLNGDKVVLAVHELLLGEQKFLVIAERPLAKALYLTIRTVLAMSILILIAIVATIMVGSLVMRQLVQPIEALSGKAKVIAEGDLNQRADVNSDDEVGVLAEAFNHMASELGGMLESLEKQVDERTRALKDAQLATLSMMEDAEEARQKTERVNEDLKAAQIATMNIMMDIEDARIKMEQVNMDLSQEKAYSDQIINSIPGVFYVFDEHGKFIRWNDNFSEITEYSHKEISQIHPIQLFSGDDAELIASRIQLVFKTGHSDAEANFTTKSGRKVPYYLTGYRTLIDNKPLLIGTGVDISERILAEEALAVKAAELERSNEELEQFAYVASHDLQEPLRMVASYLQLLDRRYSDKLGQDAREFIDFAVDGATRMKRLINDLLVYSRVGTSGDPFTSTDLDDVLDKVLVNLTATIRENHAIITFDGLPAVLSDETQMIQLFQNLIGNAIKFRQPEVPPHIHIEAEQKNGVWEFSVADNGIGFDLQFSERIFVIFQRLHGKDEYSGTGIGLAISKRIIERHGGKIWAESQPGLGTTFYFTLPISDHQVNSTF